MALSTADKINMAIAIGTGLAALGSLAAAIIASRSARRTEQFSERSAREERDRWLTGVLFSMASQCNECVSTTGVILPTKENISRLITVLYNAVELIGREGGNVNRTNQLSNLWIFLHSSIWVEIKNQSILSSLQNLDIEDKRMLNLQYNYVKKNFLPDS